MLNLDTHILVALLAGTLTPREEALVADEPLAISDIVLWELAKLVQRGRLDMDLDGAAFAVCLSRITVVPISAGIATASTRLDFASDRGNYSRSDFAAAGVISRPRASWST